MLCYSEESCSFSSVLSTLQIVRFKGNVYFLMLNTVYHVYLWPAWKIVLVSFFNIWDKLGNPLSYRYKEIIVSEQDLL